MNFYKKVINSIEYAAAYALATAIVSSSTFLSWIIKKEIEHCQTRKRNSLKKGLERKIKES